VGPPDESDGDREEEVEEEEEEKESGAVGAMRDHIKTSF